QKGANRIERNQPVCDSAEQDEQAATEYRQDDDSVGVDQTPPAVPEDVREVVILRDGAAETRKIGESCVGGERQNHENGAHGQVVEKPFTEYGGAQHGEKALVAGQARIGRHDAVSL